MERYIVTAALPYAYSIPHLGNFVGSVLPADVYYRYLKMNDKSAIFICGSDQHGTAGELKAIKEKVTPEQLSEKMHEALGKLFNDYGCAITYYGKTNTETNKEIVYEVFDALNKRGYILEVQSKLPYCNLDKRYLADTFIEGTCPYCKYANAKGNQCESCGRLLDPDQLVNPHCTICGKSDITFKTAKNLAIALDKLQEKIKAFVKERSKNHWSKNATNKALSYIDDGLKPRDITRNTKWGFPVPLKGFEDTVFYVWFDAIISYISITKDWSGSKWKEYWLGKDTKLIQFMGKDNIEFHTLMWPGILIGSDLGYTMPDTIRASEYLLSRGLKFSKTAGEGIDMLNAIKILDGDYWRFALMHLYPETSDTDFTVDLMLGIVNGVMNDNIGNLVNRVLKLSQENKDLISKSAKPIKKHIDEADKITEKYKSSFDIFALREALQAVVELSTLGNSIMGNYQPWVLAKKAESDKKAKEELSEQMATLQKIIFRMGVLLWPFTPSASKKILAYFNVNEDPTTDLLKEDKTADLSKTITPIFKKLDDTFANNFKK